MTMFRETFKTTNETVRGYNGEEYRAEEVNGKEFIVIDEKDPDTYDYGDVGKMYIIELDGGILLEAFPEEVEK